MTDTDKDHRDATADLQHLHEMQLAALVEVDAICRKHGIRYSLLAGSLLGAVRHHGFIPWDDDIDIGMPRSDYNRFIQACQTELPGPLFLQTCETDPEYPLSFAKIRINDTAFREDAWRSSTVRQGAYIDVFPLDAVPKSRFLRRMHERTLRILTQTAIYSSSFEQTDSAPLLRRVGRRGLRLAGRPFGHARVLCLIDLVRSLPSDTSELVVNTGGSYCYSKECTRREYFDAVVDCEFEGRSFSGFASSHDYLTHLYGDYMLPPPPEARVPRHQAKVHESPDRDT